jgi:L-methionine (R)-S-oxide reductase
MFPHRTLDYTHKFAIGIICTPLPNAINSHLMAESVAFSKTSDRAVIYREIAPQIAALMDGETDMTANLANVAAVLKEALGFYWVGFYLAKDDQLVLGPFQGPVACTRIDFGKGVCGHVYNTRVTEIVPDVDKFPDHIACSSASRSEIVVPLFDTAGEIRGVLDVDSDRLDDFTPADCDGLEGIASLLRTKFQS